jgi:uncharacterized protein (TIGR02117 family)
LRLLRIAGKALLTVLGILTVYLLLAVVLSLIPTRPDPVSNAERHMLYISSNGVHTDFILPRAQLPASLLDQLGEQADYDYLAFGWGDKGFYLDTPTWAQLKASTAVRAMFLPSSTAVHVTGYRRVGADWAELPATDWQIERLNEFIRATFAYAADGSVQAIDHPGYGDDDRFYEAVGSYNAVVTCNTWVNRGLKRMRVRTAVWSPSEWGIMRWRRKAGR